MEIKNRKKAVIYVRVSSREQEKGFSIPAQLRYLEEYAVKNNIKVAKIFKEAETAKKAGRKQFGSMLDYITEHDDINIILVEKTDRLYRNIKDWTKIDYEAMNLEIHLAKEGEIVSKESGSSQKFMHGIKVLMAKNYVDNLSEEVRKGLDEKLRKGILPGPAPMGYLNKRDDQTIIVDEKLAPLVKKGFELAATGNYTLSKLSKEWYKMGVRGPRSGKAIVKQQVSRILNNPFYHGVIHRKGNHYKGIHEPLITKELFDTVQHVLGFTKRPSDCKYDFVFRGPMTCAHCGSHITAETKRKKSGKTYTYYHCTNGKKSCSNVKYIREEKIEEQYLEAFKRIQLPQNIVEYTREALLSSHKEEKDFRDTKVKALTTRYKKLENYIDKLYEDKIESVIELHEWEKRTQTYKAEQDEIAVEIDALRRSNTAYMMEGIKLMEIANSASELFPLMDKAEKRELISLVLSNPVIEDATVRYDYKKPFDMFVDLEDIEKWRRIRDSNS